MRDVDVLHADLAEASEELEQSNKRHELLHAEMVRTRDLTNSSHQSLTPLLTCIGGGGEGGGGGVGRGGGNAGGGGGGSGPTDKQKSRGAWA